MGVPSSEADGSMCGVVCMEAFAVTLNMIPAIHAEHAQSWSRFYKVV